MQEREEQRRRKLNNPRSTAHIGIDPADKGEVAPLTEKLILACPGSATDRKECLSSRDAVPPTLKEDRGVSI